MKMVKKILYILIFILLANSLFWNMSGMAANIVDNESQGNNPIWEIFLDGACVFLCVLASKRSSIPVFGKWFIVFLSYVCIISIFHGLMIGFQRKTAVFYYIQPLLLFFVGFYSQHDNEIKRLTPSLVKIFACWILFLFIVNYRTVSLIMQESFFTTNSSYPLLYFTPMLVLFVKEKNRKFILLLVLFVVLLSAKRSGLVSLLIGFISYVYSYGLVYKRKRMRKLVLFILVFYFAITWMNEYMGNILFDRFDNVYDDQGSGRTMVWETTWLHIKQSDFFDSLFGHGYNSVINDVGTGYSAHNDFIEIIYDFGWIGLVLFMASLVSCLVHAIRLTIIQSKLAPVLFMALAIMITSCFFSHIVIYSLNINLFALFFGTLLGDEKDDSSIKMIST